MIRPLAWHRSRTLAREPQSFREALKLGLGKSVRRALPLAGFIVSASLGPWLASALTLKGVV